MGSRWRMMRIEGWCMALKAFGLAYRQADHSLEKCSRALFTEGMLESKTFRAWTFYLYRKNI